MKNANVNWGMLSKHRTALYGLAAISILIYHYASIYSYYPTYTRPIWATWYFEIVGSVGVEIFLFLAGIFCFYSYGKAETYKDYIKRRVVKIFPTYVLIALVFWGAEYIFFARGGIFEFLQDMFFVTFFTRGESRFWFVIAIVFFYSIYPLIHKFLFGGRKITIKFLLLEVIIIAVLSVMSGTHFFRCIQIAITRLPVFILGCYYGSRVYENKKIHWSEYLIVGIGVALKILSLFFKLNMLSERIVAMFWGFACCVLISMLLSVIVKKDLSKYNILKYCGERSLELYLINVATIKLFIDAGFITIKFVNYAVVILICLGVAAILPRLITIVLNNIPKLFNEKRLVWLVFGCALLLRTLLNLDLQTLTVPSDEFNTVSAAARIVGFNWENVNSSNGYYGYTAILTYIPVFLVQKWIHNPYVAYQLLLFMNSLMMALYTLIIYHILCILGKEKVSKNIMALLALIASFVPQFFGVGQLTQNESTYSLLHILVIYMLILCCKSDNKWKKAGFSVICAFSTMLCIAGNNRGVVIIIATVMTIIIGGIYLKKHVVNYIVFFISLIGGALLHYNILYPYFRSFFPEETYNTDANIIFERIPRILSNFEDLKAILVTALSWVYTFIVSTYGMGIVVIGVLLFFIIKIRKVKELFSIEENVINIILILWLIGTTCLCVINFLDSIQGILQYNIDIAYNPTRVDKIFYFRYYIAIAPFAISYTVLMLLKYDLLKYKKIVVATGYLFVCIALYFHAYIGANLNGLSYATSSTNLVGLFLGAWTENYKYGTVYSGRFLFLTIVAMVVISVFVYCIREKRVEVFLRVFLVLEVLTCVIYSGIYMAPRTEVWKDCVNQEIIEMIEDNDEVKEVFVQQSGYAFLYQFFMPDNAVYTEYDCQDAIVTKSGSDFETKIATNYKLIYSNDVNSLWIVK